MTSYSLGEPVVILSTSRLDQDNLVDWPLRRCTRDQPGVPSGDLAVSQGIGSVGQLLKPGCRLDIAFRFAFRGQQLVAGDQLSVNR